jgi:hypothetical protein
MAIKIEALDCRQFFSASPLAPYGDADGNNVVDTRDFVALAQDFGQSGSSPADFNGDGVVNAMDFDSLATNFGHRWMTERYIHIAFDHWTNKLVVGESNDGVHFENYYEPNYTPAIGSVRDVSAWYDPDAHLWYIAHTCYNIDFNVDPIVKHWGPSFAIATSTDLQTFTPYMQVDCSAVIGQDQAPWAPQFLPSWYRPSENRTFLSFMRSYSGDTFMVQVDLQNRTTGPITQIQAQGSSGFGSDPLIVPPDGNLTDQYLGLGGTGGVHLFTSDQLTGPYSFLTNLQSNGSEQNEAPFYLPMDDGSARIYVCGDKGTVFFPVTGSGDQITIGAEQPTFGDRKIDGLAYDVGQGDIVDGKLTGYWAS